MKRLLLVSTLILIGITSVAATPKVDAELEAKKVVAMKVVRAASNQSQSKISVQDAYRAKGKIVIQLTESYVTKFDGVGYADEEEAGVMCNKTIEFSADPKDSRLKVIKLFDGLCFS